VVVAQTVPEVQRAGRPDTLLLIAETANTRGDALTDLASVPGDRLILEPTVQSREALAPAIRLSSDGRPENAPGCAMREADRAGLVTFDGADTYQHGGDTSVIRCYGGALVRYTTEERTVTVVGSAEFMTNGGIQI
jgi:hypothetical protein